MSWQIEIPLIIRTWINDLSDNPTYSDDRLLQLVPISAQHVLTEIELPVTYEIDIINASITPDPTLSPRDIGFIGLISLKASCMLDQSSFRTKAISEGIKAVLGPAALSVNGNLRGYETILNQGPCALYRQLKDDYIIGNQQAIHAILSPFVGNNFDSRYLQDYSDRSRYFYS